MNENLSYQVFALRENRQIGFVINPASPNYGMFESLLREGKLVHVYSGGDKTHVDKVMEEKRNIMEALPELKDRPLAGLLGIILPEAMHK